MRAHKSRHLRTLLDGKEVVLPAKGGATCDWKIIVLLKLLQEGDVLSFGEEDAAVLGEEGRRASFDRGKHDDARGDENVFVHERKHVAKT